MDAVTLCWGLQVVKALSRWPPSPRQKDPVEPMCSEYSIGWFVLLVIGKGFVLCHLSVRVQNGVSSSEISAILGSDRAGLMDQSSDERHLRVTGGCRAR